MSPNGGGAESANACRTKKTVDSSQEQHKIFGIGLEGRIVIGDGTGSEFRVVVVPEEEETSEDWKPNDAKGNVIKSNNCICTSNHNRLRSRGRVILLFDVVEKVKSGDKALACCAVVQLYASFNFPFGVLARTESEQ